MAVSKRLRFEMLRRDGFACRYCGVKAPEAELTVDHIVPVTLGGTDLPANLTTACVDCNAGKSSTSPDADLVEAAAAAEAEWRSVSRPFREAVCRLYGALPAFDSAAGRADLADRFDALHEDDEDEDGVRREYDWPEELKAFYVAVRELADTHWWVSRLLVTARQRLAPAAWQRYVEESRELHETSGVTFQETDVERYAVVCALIDSPHAVHTSPVSVDF